MKKIFRKEAVIGLSAIAALGILIFGINYLKGINIFKAVNYYYTTYTNVDALAVSDAVTINGYKVGHVRSIQYQYDNPGHVTVELSLDKHLKVPVGSKAVLTHALLGTASIELQLASASEYCKVGDTIEGVVKPTMIETVGTAVSPVVDDIMPKVDTLLANLNAITGDPAVISSVQRLDAITADLQRTAANLALVTGQLAPVVKNVQQLTDNVNGISADLGEVAADLKEVPLDSIASDLQATIENLRELSDQLNNPDSTIGLLASDPSLYNNLNSTAASLDSLLIDIKANPKRYINIKVF